MVSSPTTQPTPFRLPRATRGLTRRALSALFNPAAERALALHRLTEIYHGAHADRRPDDTRHFVEKVLDQMNVKVDINPAELERIPKTGPVVITANHPFGAVDGMILMAILRRARPDDSKVLVNYLLSRIQELRDMLICVDPFGSESARTRNLAPLKEAMRWVKDGHALATFPAGEVAHFNFHQRAIVDPQWSDTVGRIVRRTGAQVVPLYFHGRNSQVFQLLGMIHPRLRTAMLPRELLKKKQRTIKVRIGHPIPASRLAEFGDDRRLTDYLRLRTYLLAAGLHRRRRSKLSLRPQQTQPDPADGEPIVPAQPAEVLEREIAALPAGAHLVTAGEQAVYLATAGQIPHMLRELGRLREVTFRAVGEGTGRPIDLDRFDETYLHLFIWHRADRQLVGAYRLGQTDRIVPHQGVAGLYTSTLFDFGEKLIRQISPALEMGRSFVAPPYQKSYAPLMNLWKGIATFVCRNPRYVHLFGPVSISNDYHDLSRRLIVDFLTANELAPQLARLARPKHPMRRRRRGKIVKGFDSVVINDIDEVSDLIADIERQPKGVPILLKQYLRLNAKLLGFNIDPDFGDVLDGLIVIDLRQTDPRILGKYMGREACRAYLAGHGVQ